MTIQRLMEGIVKEHEKFIAFMMIGAALVIFGVMLYVRPLPDSQANSGVLQILNLIVGALISAFGAAVQALLKINNSGENTVTVQQPKGDPIPVTQTAAPTDVADKGELPEDEKL